MPSPASSRPRAPEEAYGRRFSSGMSARPRATRRQLSARDRSAAVSASVPSKSKSTALVVIPDAAERIVDAAVFAQAVLVRHRVVGHALEFDRLQPRIAAPARQFRRLDEARIVVRPLGKHLQQVLRADHREQVGLRIAVDGGEKNMAAGFHELGAGGHRARGPGHVFEQFHAGHDIEAAGRSFLQFFGGNQLVSNGQPALEQVQLRDPEGFFRKVDAGHIGAEARHRLAQDSAAAADVEHALAGEMRQAVDPAQAQWIELVQRPEFALRVPPAVRELAEFRELGRVCVLFHGCHKQKAPPQRGFSRAARLAYLRVPMTSISTRRFFWRPSFVLLLATGCFSPLPSVYTRFGSMPFDTRYALTASARRTDSFWL